MKGNHISALFCLFFSWAIYAANHQYENSAPEYQQAIYSLITKSDYTAVVKIKSVERLPDTLEEDGWVAQKVTANIETAISGDGPLIGDFEYIEFVEANDENLKISNKPLLLGFCRDKSKWYWAGVGAYFDATEAVIVKAKDVARNLESPSHHRRFCE